MSDDILARIEERLGGEEQITSDPVDEVEEILVESEGESQDEAEVVDGEVAPDEEQEGAAKFESLSDFAEALDMPMDDLLANVKGRVKIDGQEFDVSLKELQDGYQRESNYQKKMAELAEQRKAVESEYARTKQDLSAKISEAESTIDFATKQLLSEFNSIDWQDLRASDPAEFAARQQEYANLAQAITEKREHLTQESSRLEKERQASEALRMQDAFKAEGELLLEKIPAWRDSARASKDVEKITSFMSEKYGMSSDYLNSIWSHQAWVALHDLVSNYGGSSKVEAVKKMVKTLPKLVKAGARIGKEEHARVSQKNTLDAFRKSGGDGDMLHKILLDRMG